MRKYQFFSANIELQQKWLNAMAQDGWRLTEVKRTSYYFEKAVPSEFQYEVVFVADKSNREYKDYVTFLEDKGYRVFPKNINLNYSVGKVRIRPWAKGSGILSTSPGRYNKELLIVEKPNDGSPFEI